MEKITIKGEHLNKRPIITRENIFSELRGIKVR